MKSVHTDETAKKLVDALQEKLAELDAIGAQIAAAHLESAIHALARQFAIALETSEVD